MQKLKVFFRIGKHYKMERFSILIIMLSVLMIFVLFLSFNAYLIANRVSFGAMAVYSTKLKTSKSGVNGSVVNVYTNQDRTKAFLLLKLENVDYLSTDASNYQLFLTSSAEFSNNPQKIKPVPSASTYVFGSTGYLGFYFVNTQGFPEQILDLTVRCNSEIVKSIPKDKPNADLSFDKFDQFRVLFNPGARDAVVLDCLSSDEAVSVFALYNEMVIMPKERVSRELLDAELADMKISMNAISEYSTRLEQQYSIVIPPTPDVIAGDEILITKESQTVIQPPVESGGESIETTSEIDILALRTTYTVSKGVDFDWRSGSVADGYLGDLGYSDYVQFSKAKELEVAESALSTEGLSWYFKDGSLLSDLDSGSVTAEHDRYLMITADIQLLLGSWNKYYTQKKLYQTTTLRTLLTLEDELFNIDQVTSVHTGDDMFLVY